MANLWKKNSWILHHDNEFFFKTHQIQSSQLPYSPHMAPAGFFFLKLKLPFRSSVFISRRNKGEFVA